MSAAANRSIGHVESERARLGREIAELQDEIKVLEERMASLERRLPDTRAEAANAQAACIRSSPNNAVDGLSSNDRFRLAQVELRTTEVGIKQTEASLEEFRREVSRREGMIRQLDNESLRVWP